MKKLRFRFAKGGVSAVVVALGMFLALSTAWADSQEDQKVIDETIIPNAEAGVYASTEGPLHGAADLAWSIDDLWNRLSVA